MTENAPRLNLSGQAVGMVTAAQTLHAKQQAKRQRGQARRNQAKATFNRVDDSIWHML
jgi:ProP effector